MGKGNDTRKEILKVALEMSSQLGLENVTIGNLSKEVSMSKSGLFAHFQSKENLQIAILDYAAGDFVQHVLHPALKEEAGSARVRKLVEKWIDWGNSVKGGCVFVTASSEYSDRPGLVHDHLLAQQKGWVSSLKKIGESARKVGRFRPERDVGQFAFDLYALLLGYHYYFRLLQDPDTRYRQEQALDNILNSYFL